MPRGKRIDKPTESTKEKLLPFDKLPDDKDERIEYIKSQLSKDVLRSIEACDEKKMNLITRLDNAYKYLLFYVTIRPQRIKEYRIKQGIT